MMATDGAGMLEESLSYTRFVIDLRPKTLTSITVYLQCLLLERTCVLEYPLLLLHSVL